MSALVLLMTNGCQSARELKDLVIVMGIGMDDNEQESGKVTYTAQIVLPEKISSSQNGGKSVSIQENPYFNLESSANNTFEAVREYTHMETGKLYIAHAQVFVFGKKMAERGIAPYMDFFVRARETRPSAKIVVSETTARDVLDIKPNMGLLPAIDLSLLVETQAANSQSTETDLLDYINAMQSNTTSMIAPIVSIAEKQAGKTTYVSGMAVFKHDQMVGELNKNETRGALWVLGKIKSAVINVNIYGGIASLEVLSSVSNVSPVVSNGKVTMKISISVSVELAEQTCKENLATRENIKLLQSLVGQAICDDISMAYYKACTLNADVFGFGDMVHKYYNQYWKDMEPNWDKLFSEITLDIKTDVSVIGSGAIEKPVWTKEEK